jgi:hypothetical protein
MDTGARPGSAGVTVDGAVDLSDLWRLTARGGRNIEFALTRELEGGVTVHRLYSGTPGEVRVPIRRDVELVAHTQPGGSLRPSSADYETLRDLWKEKLKYDPNAPAPVSTILNGPDPAANAKNFTVRKAP